MSSQTYRLTTPITTQRDVYGQSISALSFDPVSDALWTGNSSGLIVSCYGASGLRGVSFPVGGDLQVKKIVAGDQIVRALGTAGRGVGQWSKGGTNKWFYRSPHTVTTFTNVASSSSHIAISTNVPELHLVNSTTGTLVRQMPATSIITHMTFSHSLLLSGSADGMLRTHDLRVGKHGEPEASVKAHMKGIQGLEVTGNLVFTIGWGVRQSRPFPDPLVKIYDVRTFRALPPISFPAGPGFITALPKRSSSVVVTSNRGLVNIVDASNPNSASEFYQLDVPSYISAVAASPTGAFLGFGDAEGVVHLMTAADEGSELPLNGFDGQPLEYADIPEPTPEIAWTDSTPLNSIGMPFYNSLLLSSWTSHFVPSNLYYPPPAKIPSVILNSMKVNEFVGYATLPKELRGRRNVAIPAPKKDSGRFKSGKFRRYEPEPETPTTEYAVDHIPRPFRNVEIQYSKFGVEDFDFGFYNKTTFSGLETHIMNSYTNALVQVMNYSEPMQRLATSHITTNCQREHCLLCELGFLMRMLVDANGINCQASNFCKTVGALAQAGNSIELIDFGRPDADYAHMIQSFHRFLLDHLSSEGNSFPHNPNLLPSSTPTNDFHSPAAAPVTQVLGIDAKNVIVCSNCNAVREKENMAHVVDMVYPRKGASGSNGGQDFASILRNSLLREMSHKATCQTCKQFATFQSRRAIPSKDLPPVLAVNAAVFTEENLKYWVDDRQNTFLKPSVEIRGQANGVDDPESVIYDLRSFVVQVVSKDKTSHLVALIKVPAAESDPDVRSPWYIFNDFVVSNISEAEALSFPSNWKVPAVIYLERRDLISHLDYGVLPHEEDYSILSNDISLSPLRDKKLMRHELLRFEELPKMGTMVAIDAEFVQMQQEETEYRSDGTKKVLRPARLSLARVSVLRGDGQKEGVPFIDDHIHTSEMVVDYLTEYSGIRYGDLDPHVSRHTLVPLKVAYKKLRLLVDLKCIFIGHGLAKDFRIINIFVPGDQIIDTVDVWWLESRSRRLSLRFLSWFVLGENIQSETHDSIEDARCALQLYKASLEMQSVGTFDEKIDELYREGGKHNWKPPQAPAAVSASPLATEPRPDATLPPVTPGLLPAFTLQQGNPSRAGNASPGLFGNLGGFNGHTPRLQNFSPSGGQTHGNNFGQYPNWSGRSPRR